MKLLIISDTHGRYDLVRQVAQLHKSREGLVFLGDGVRDIDAADLVNNEKMLVGVRGNCDFTLHTAGYDYPEEQLIYIGEYKVLVMHGHRYDVKHGIDRALAYAAKKGADILLFGHTHIPLEKYYPAGTELCDITLSKPLYAFNPGSLGAPRGNRPTYGLMQIQRGQLLFSHGEI